MKNDKLSVCIAPFTKSSIPLANHLSLLNPSWVFTTALSPSGTAIINRDVGQLLNFCELNVLGTDQIETLCSCDIVIITPNNEENPALYQMADDALMYALTNQKEVWCLQHFPSDKLKNFKAYPFFSSKFFHYLPMEKIQSKPSLSEDNTLFSPKVPVVGIGELVDDVDGFEVLLRLVQECQKRGLKTSVICQNPLGRIFGFHAVNLIDKKIDYEKRIHEINRLLHKVDSKEKPDLIFVLFPYPLIPYNEKITFDFGISSFLLAQAVKFSYFICCSQFENFPNEFWASISQNFEAKFGFHVDAVHRSNRFYDDSEETWSTKYMPRICLALSFVESTLPSVRPNDFIFNLTISNHSSILCDRMIQQLFHAPYYLLD